MGFSVYALAAAVVIAWRFWPMSNSDTPVAIVATAKPATSQCNCNLSQQIEQFKMGESILRNHFEGMMSKDATDAARLKLIDSLLESP